MTKKLIAVTTLLAVIFIGIQCSNNNNDSEPKIGTATVSNVRYLPGDTIAVAWTGEATNVSFSITYGAANLNAYNALSPVLVSGTTAKIIVPSDYNSDSCKIKLTAGSSSSETGLFSIQAIGEVTLSSSMYFPTDTLTVTWAGMTTNVKFAFTYGPKYPDVKDSTIAPVSMTGNTAKLMLPAAYTSDSCKIKLTAGTAHAESNIFPIKWLVLINPKGGESFTQGQTVTVRWKKYSAVSSVGVKLYFNNGADATELASGSISAVDTFNWVVGSEFQGPTYPASNCFIKAYDYAAEGATNYKSGKFSLQ